MKKQRKLKDKIFTKYYNLVQNLQKSLTAELYCNIILSCLFKNTARQVNSKVILTIFYYINALSFKKFHTEAVKGEI